MIEQLEARLRELRAEFEKGQQKLQEMESEANVLRNMLLRIGGAVQVIEEELEKNAKQKNGQAQALTSTEKVS